MKLAVGKSLLIIYFLRKQWMKDKYIILFYSILFIWLLPLTLPSSSVQYAGPATHRKTEKRDNLLIGEWEGVGEEQNHTMARKPDPLLIIQ
jgi:hypothetical protein